MLWTQKGPSSSAHFAPLIVRSGSRAPPRRYDSGRPATSKSTKVLESPSVTSAMLVQRQASERKTLIHWDRIVIAPADTSGFHTPDSMRVPAA